MSIVGGSTAVGKRGWVTPLCWSAVLLDGFDLVVLGTVIPVLLADAVWGITLPARPRWPRRAWSA